MSPALPPPGVVRLSRSAEPGRGGRPPHHPPDPYPEYPFPSAPGGENADYGRVRDLLAAFGLDRERFGTAQWNPLGGLLRPGGTALIKPNMVMHAHARGLGMEGVITRGSVVRPLVDYAYLALGGRGRIIIADAPLQCCDFGRVTALNGCAAIAEFYRREAGFAVELIDLRSAAALKDDWGAVRGLVPLPGGPRNLVAVELGARSRFAGREDECARYRATNYSPRAMRRFHGGGAHRYLIPREALAADLVVNVPKPKTHRKAGVSIAMKNLVGLAGDKACLPHHRRGSPASGGDEYPRRSALKASLSWIQERIDEAGIRGRRAPFPGLRAGRRIAEGLVRRFLKDRCLEGCWWGNDTIARMICDLNTILSFADRDGTLRDSPQRAQLVVADGITAGEGEGPLGPDPVQAGFLAIGLNAPAVDAAAARVMGFDPEKIPHIRDAFSLPLAPAGVRGPGDVAVLSDHPPWSGPVAGIRAPDTLRMRAPEGWAGHIEVEP